MKKILIILFLIILSSVCWGQELLYLTEDSTLLGIDGFYLEICLNEDANIFLKNQIDSSVIRTIIEVNLRKAGIPLFTESKDDLYDRDDPKDIEHLYYYINLMKLDDIELYVYTLELNVQQTVDLIFLSPANVEMAKPEDDYKLFDDGIIALAFLPTWSRSYLGCSFDVSKIKGATEDLTNELINAYLKVNPKE